MMKARISITLSDELLQKIDALAGGAGQRSGAIERLLRGAVRRVEKRRRFRADVEALNRYADAHADEILDTIRYQTDPFTSDD